MDDAGTEEKKLSWLQENLELQWGNPPLGSGHDPRRFLEAEPSHFTVWCWIPGYSCFLTL